MEYVEFPLVDSSGVRVRCDRRVNEDRRSKMIVISEFISDTQFSEYFESGKG